MMKKHLLPMAFLLLYSGILSSQELNLTTPLSALCNEPDRKIFDSIVHYYYGVAGSGFIGRDEWITNCEAEASGGGPWKPVDGFKRSLCGYLSLKTGTIPENDDGDIDMYVIPDPPFRWLQFNSLRPRGHYYDAYSLCCETALKEPGDTPANDGVYYLRSLPLGDIQYKPVGVYGPYVSDMGHDRSPEIHPVQQLWMTTPGAGGSASYRLYSMYDNSKRFNDPTDFPSGCLQNPWMPIPLINTFYVPFEIKLGSPGPLTSFTQLVYSITMPSSNNINLYPATENQLRLVVNGQTRLVVNKPGNQFPVVTFYNVCQTGANTIRGYLAIETSIGKTGLTSGAHAFLNMTRTVKTIEPVIKTKN